MSKKKHLISALHVVMSFKPGNCVQRCAEAATIAAKCPTSALYAAQPSVKVAADSLKQRGLDLAAKDQACADAWKAWEFARTDEEAEIVAFDKAAQSLRAAVQGTATTPGEVVGLGCTLALVPGQVPLGKVLAIGLKDGALKASLDIHVQHLTGLRGYRTQISVDPVTATSWVELPGVVAKHTVLGLVRGARYWVRACSCRGTLSGEWSDPVPFVIA